VAADHTVQRMTPRLRSALIAVIALAAVGLTGCGKTNNPPSNIPGSSEPPGVSATPVATPTITAPPAGAGLSGTLLFLGTGNQAGGVYYSHNGNWTYVIPETSFEFYQSVTFSSDGKRFAWVPGAQAQLRVNTENNPPPQNIGPSTISSDFTPQFSQDGNLVFVAYGSGQRGWLNLTSATITAVPSASPYNWSLFSPDTAYAVQNSNTGAWRVVHADGTSPVGAQAPAGKEFNRILSLSPDGHHVIALLKNPGDPSGDVTRVFAANAIVEVTSGTSQAVPGGGLLHGGFYLLNGNLVLRESIGGVDTVVLASPAGVVLGKAAVPGQGASFPLLGYIP
jgi:hypothetical protein